MPSNIVNTPDSHAPIIGRLTFSDGDNTIVLPVEKYLQALHVELHSFSSWSAEVTLFDVEDELEEAFLVAGRRGLFTFQWGWDSPYGLSGCPEYRGRIVRYLPTFTPQGTQYKLCLVPAPVAEGFLDKREDAYTENESLSNAVEAIVKRRGYATKNRRGQPTIQHTDSVFPESISTNGESELKFLREYVAPYALDDQGRGGFEVSIDESGALHFHNSYFAKPILAAIYQCFRDPAGEVREFSPVTDGYFTGLFGGGNTVYQSADSDGGTRVEVITTSTDGVPGVPTTALVDATAQVDLGTTAQSRVHIVERTPTAFAARVAAQYARLSQLRCNARLVTRGTHAASVYDYIHVDYFRRDGSKHPLAGNYKVYGIIHDWTTAGWSTDFDLTRDGISPIPGTVGDEVGVTIDPRQTNQTQTTGNNGQGQTPGATEDHPVADTGPARVR